MKIKLHYGDGVLVLPAAVANHLTRADEDALRLLLALAGENAPTRDRLAKRCGCDVATIDRALAFWQGTGLLDLESDGRKKALPTEDKKETPAASEKTPAAVPRAMDSAKAIVTMTTTLPTYTTEDMVHILEGRRELATLLDECSRVFGKVFSSHETGILLGIVDHLGVDGEWLLLLLAHCVKIGKHSLRYVERTAISFYDEGIVTPDALQEALRAREEREEATSRIRTLFGMQSRALSTKERRLIDTWLSTYRYGLDIITRAYEIAVDAIGKSSIPYTNSILERWATSDLHTLEEINAAEEARTANGKTPATAGNSFDTDDFFDAALKRSFGDDYTPAKS